MPNVHQGRRNECYSSPRGALDTAAELFRSRDAKAPCGVPSVPGENGIKTQAYYTPSKCSRMEDEQVDIAIPPSQLNRTAASAIVIGDLLLQEDHESFDPVGWLRTTWPSRPCNQRRRRHRIRPRRRCRTRLAAHHTFPLCQQPLAENAASIRHYMNPMCNAFSPEFS